MIVEKINYQRTFNLGNYSSERIGVDININAGEEPNVALDMAKKLVEEWHVKNNPQLYQDKTPEIPIVRKSFVVQPIYDDYADPYPSSSDKLPSTLTEQINSCTSIKTLESYKFIVKGKPELEEAYSKRLKELT